MNKRQEPRLRFKGFMETWEEKTLNDVSEIFEYGLNAQAVNFDGVHKYIRITDIDDESRQFLQENVTSPDVDFSKADNYKLQKGDLLFARTGASVGKSYLYNENDGLVYFAGFLIRAKLNKEVDDQFIFQNTLTNHFNRFVTLTSQRSGQPGINSKEYSEFEFLAPSLPEQTHLGLFFSRLDSQIAESRAVLEKSRQLKKAMLAKMFPANGEKIPKIRFKGFEGEWKTRSLRDVLEIERKGKAQYQKLQAGNVPYLDAEFLNGGVKILTDAVSDVDVNDILIIWDGSNAGKVYTGFNGVLGSTLKSYRTNADCSSMFLYQELVRNEEVIFSQYRTPNIPHVIKDFSDEYNFLMPSYTEQTAIGNFFRQLDETIALQTAEVEKLNQLKKGLLAAMLV